MEPHTIEIEKLSGDSQADLGVFDTKLTGALQQKISPVILRLNPEMPAGMLLVEWLEDWNRKFHKAGMVFMVVAESSLQAQSIELSHPDDELHFVTSLDDIAKYLPAETGPVKIAPEPAASSTISMPTLLQPVASPGLAPSSQTAQDDFTSVAQSPSNPPPVMHCDEITKLSGEYICLSCGASRMWLKGDTVTNCDNPECLKPDQGWQLTWELF
jgi:hypothetical protein